MSFNAEHLLRESPPHIAALIEQYGADRVWRIGLNVLGYPVSWEPNGLELLTLAKELKNHG